MEPSQCASCVLSRMGLSVELDSSSRRFKTGSLSWGAEFSSVIAYENVADHNFL